MNREQRRAAKREGVLDEEGEAIGMSLREWLEDPEKVTRRGEVAAVAERVYMYKRWQERRNRWYNRCLRAIRAWFQRNFFLSPTEEEVRRAQEETGEDDDG